MSHYFSLNEYCRNQFGHKLYKLSLDGGMSCPNRDGKIGTRGCIFCSAEGSGDFAEKRCEDIFTQIERAKARVEHKNKGGKYIAYFQSYTNTYASTDYLEKIFTEAINHPDVEVLSIATRPDCVDEEVVKLLSGINEIKPVWVELGFQTADEKSAEYIRRGYKNHAFASAVRRLEKAGIRTVAHVILGLPDEDYSVMENTVRFVCDCGIWGIKLHLLHVLSGTDLAEDYLGGNFVCMEKNEYLETICSLLTVIPENVVIHRLTGDGDKKKLIAPMWSANKKDVLNSLNAMLRDRNIVQGSNI